VLSTEQRATTLSSFSHTNQQKRLANPARAGEIYDRNLTRKNLALSRSVNPHPGRATLKKMRALTSRSRRVDYANALVSQHKGVAANAAPLYLARSIACLSAGMNQPTSISRSPFRCRRADYRDTTLSHSPARSHSLCQQIPHT
jgi:hypothetical protein